MTDLKNWEEFEQKYQQFVVWHEKLQHDHQPLRVSNLLFRGQASAGWPLKTTLERYTQDAAWTLPDYFRRMHTTKAAVETYTDKSWDIPAPHFYDLWLKEKGNSPAGLPQPPGYDYMVYLRHHNFPSPLLDWSRSPYIAAFFAFMHASPNENGRVAIYVFLEWQGEFNPGGPWVIGHGPNVRSHKRHFFQQSEYTICAQHSDGIWSYASHEKVLLEQEGINPKRLWKFTIPVTKRTKVLKMLDDYNVNALSLFGSEESLIETAAARVFVYPRKSR